MIRLLYLYPTTITDDISTRSLRPTRLHIIDLLQHAADDAETDEAG